MRGLVGRSAVVTGGGSGIGKAIALRLGAEGMIVGVFDLNGEAAASTVKEIGDAGGRAVAQVVDITDYPAVVAAVDAFEAEVGPVHVLVNNAGWDRPTSFITTTPEFWKKVIDINLYGPIHMTHAVAGRMAGRKDGRIIFIASDAGRVGSTGEVVYSACKGGTIAFAKALAREVARAGVLVNTICPGPTNTPAMDAFAGTGEQGQKIRDSLTRSVPLGRIGEAEDYPGMVAFFASDDAKFITGQTISVSGGLSMHG